MRRGGFLAGQLQIVTVCLLVKATAHHLDAATIWRKMESILACARPSHFPTCQFRQSIHKYCRGSQ